MHRDICSCSGGSPRCGNWSFFWVFLEFGSPCPLPLPSPKLQFFVLMMTSYVLVLPIMYSTFFSFSAYQIFFFHVFIFLKKKLSFFLGLIPLTVRLPDPTHTLNTSPSFFPPPKPPQGLHFFLRGFFLVWFGLFV